MTINNKKRLSLTIDFLRFPLTVGVVFIHAPIELITKNIDSFPFAKNIDYLISENIARIAVPLFFFISGFLFFKSTHTFDKSIYISKIRKRINTLVVPYILWNLIILIPIIAKQLLVYYTGASTEKGMFIVEDAWINWLRCFWDWKRDTDFSYPINYPLWFIRDLIVMSAFSPFIYYLIRKLEVFFILFLSIIWLLNLWPNITGFSITALFFFSFGAYWSIHKKDFIEILSKYHFSAWGGFYMIITAANLMFQNQVWSFYLHQTGILIGMAAVITLSAHYIQEGKWHSNTFFNSCNFFIYAFHAIPLTFLITAVSQLLQPKSECSITIIYLTCPLLIIALGVILSWTINKLFPQIARYLTGGR